MILNPGGSRGLLSGQTKLTFVQETKAGSVSLRRIQLPVRALGSIIQKWSVITFLTLFFYPRLFVVCVNLALQIRALLRKVD